MVKKTQRSRIISVFGGREADPKQCEDAEIVGKAIAERGWILLCGGRSGIMEAVSRGCNEAGGLTVGILPGTDDSDANSFVSIPIATGIGLARNEILACACDAAVAIGGKYGTLSEIGHALQYGKSVIVLGSWDIPGTIAVHSAEEAVLTLDSIMKSKELS